VEKNIKYIASISSNYPYKLYGCFVSDNDSDYLHFIEGRYIEKLPEFKIVYKITHENIEQLLKWDILAMDRSFYLINKKTENIFNENCKNCVQFIECKIITEDNYKIDGYKILNIINTTDYNADIIRDKNNLYVYYSKRIIMEIKRNKIKGLIFYEMNK
jgi:hypothetical protein